MDNKRKVLLIEPSAIIARGLESLLGDMGEFKVSAILTDISRSGGARLRQIDADIVVVNPEVLDYDSRARARSIIAEYTDIPAVALLTSPCDEEALRQWDAVITVHDSSVAIVKKLRAALESGQESSRVEGEELSAREKEILICVAKGMLNKEIADLYNISIYTVITHRKNITRKTGIKTVAGLTVYALLNNLIDINTFD